jgi:hypothetical protein
MNTEEKRMCRREIINFVLQEVTSGQSVYLTFFPDERLTFIKHFTREHEAKVYGLTLAIYSQYVTYN